MKHALLAILSFSILISLAPAPIDAAVQARPVLNQVEFVPGDTLELFLHLVNTGYPRDAVFYCVLEVVPGQYLGWPEYGSEIVGIGPFTIPRYIDVLLPFESIPLGDYSIQEPVELAYHMALLDEDQIEVEDYQATSFTLKPVEPQDSPIRLNEVVFHGDAGGEWIELVNPSAEAADLDGFELASESGDQYRIPEDLPPVPPGGFVLIRLDGLGTTADDYDFGDDLAELHSESLTGDVMDDQADRLSIYSGPSHDEDWLVDFVTWGNHPHHGPYVPQGDGAGGHALLVEGESIGVDPLVYSDEQDLRWVFYVTGETSPGVENPLAAPLAMVPFDGDRIYGDTVPFSWMDWGVGERSYRLEVDDDPAFGSPEIAEELDLPRHVALATLAEGEHHWRIRCELTGGGESGWSPARSFELLALPTTKDLEQADLTSVPALLARKDTGLIYLDGTMSGAYHSWDGPHSATEGSCNQCRSYAPQACVAMLNRHFGGQISQDYISFEVFHTTDGNPADDLGPGQGFGQTELDIALYTALNRYPTWTAVTFERIKTNILANQPMILQTGSPGATTLLVIAGFLHDGPDTRILIIRDPLTGTSYNTAYTDAVPWPRMLVVPPTDSQAVADPSIVTDDSDGDGLVDLDEEHRLGTLVGEQDTDQDELTDKLEVQAYCNGVGRRPRYPKNGLGIWLQPNFDGDGMQDGEEDLDKSGEVADDECDPFLFEAGLRISFLIAGAQDGCPVIETNGNDVTACMPTYEASGYHLRGGQFEWCQHLTAGQNTLTFEAIPGSPDYDDIQIRNLELFDLMDGGRLLLSRPGPIHLGDTTVAKMWEEYEEGTWSDPNPPGFWAPLHGGTLTVTFQWSGPPEDIN